jgi:integrase
MAKAVLTDSKIRGIKAAPGERQEYADALVEGLRLRVSGRSKTWAMRFRVDGKVRTVTLGEFGDDDGELGVADARTRAAELRKAARKGELPAVVAPRRRAGSNRLSDQIDGFQKRYAAERVKRPESYRWMFDKYVVPHLGDRDITGIRRRELAEHLDTIADRHGVTTARRVGGLLKRLFKFAASRDVIENDPAAALMLPGAERQRERTLTEAEIKALWKATDPATKPDERNKAGRIKPHPSDFPWGAYFRLLLLTGQRRSEVATMRWSAVDLNAGTWALEAAEVKSARAHLVPLSPLAVKLLKALPRFSSINVNGDAVPCDFVLTTNGRTAIADFSKPKGWLDKAMLVELGELPHWVVHDIRRTVSTNLARLGIDPFVRRRVLNHALTGVDAIYDRHDYLEPKRRALDIWAHEIERIVGDKSAGGNVVALRTGE